MKNKYIADTYIMMALIRDLTNASCLLVESVCFSFERQIERCVRAKIIILIRQPIYLSVLITYLF